MASSLDNLTSIETWAFRPSFQTSWFSEALDGETEAITKALQRSISNTPSSSPPPPPSEFLNTAVKPGTPSSNSSDPETVSKRPRNAAPPMGKISKRRSRASKRSPTTFITADPENFRQMVQQVTGVRFTAGEIPAGSVVKPEPQRPPVGLVNRVHQGAISCLLPTLDTSAFLLDHHHQQVVGPTAGAVVGQGALGFGSPAVVAEGGGPVVDFDGFSSLSFPTLESCWKVM